MTAIQFYVVPYTWSRGSVLAVPEDTGKVNFACKHYNTV